MANSVVSRSMLKKLFVALPLILAINAHAQKAPDKTVEALRVAPGLEVTLFAAEPDLRNPTAMDVDAYGRVWVVEAANYRVWKNPYGDEKGDRVRVLEDTDGDGRCDKATTFYQDESLLAPLGIAVLGDRVYICQSPDLYYLEDTNGDGVADKKTVVLSGFAGADHDHALHGVMFGADGRLYMSVGDQGMDVTDKSGNRVVSDRTGPVTNAVVLRSDLDGNRLELLAHSMRNPYEPTVDSFGNVFISDNDDDGNEQTRINYVIEGGDYGYRHPRTKGDRRLDSVHWNEDRAGTIPKMIKTGFGSPTGLLFYEGAHLPPMYHNTLIHADAGPRVVRSYRPHPVGAGYSAHLEIMVSAEGDDWFRPSDVCAAPDGSVFIADWYDPGVGGHNLGDWSQGRIYRLAAEDTPYTVPTLDLESDEGLSAAFGSPNLARRYLAHVELTDRLEGGDAKLLRRFWEGDNPVMRARALWLLGANKKTADIVERAMNSGDPATRIQAIRVAALNASQSDPPKRLRKLAKDPHPGVRRQLILALGEYEDEWWAWSSLIELAVQYDGQDRFYREAVGIAFAGAEEKAFDDIVEAAGSRWTPQLANLAVQFHTPEAVRLARNALEDSGVSVELKKIAMQTLDEAGGPENGGVLVALTGPEHDVEIRRHAFHLLKWNGGDAWREVTAGVDFDERLKQAWNHPELRASAVTFIQETRRSSLAPLFAELAADESVNENDRVDALETVGVLGSRIPGPQRDDVLAQIRPIVEGENVSLALAAAEAAASIRSPNAVSILKDVVRNIDKPRRLRETAALSIGASKPGALMLLDLAEQGELPTDLTLPVSELLHRDRDENVRLMAAQILPRERSREGEELPPMAELIAMRGSASAGRDIFFSLERGNCARCHTVQGEGKDIGPDLSKIGQKYGREGLFESILNPSAAIGHEYEVWLVESKELGYVDGYIRAETPKRLELVNSAGELLTVEKSDIVDRRKSAVSLMPDGLASGLSVQEFADLVAFLESLK